MILWFIGFACGFILNLIVSIIANGKRCKKCLYQEMFEKELEGIMEALNCGRSS